MRQSAKGEGTKIAQAAKDLNVTSVTIRRYISEFNIETTADENGIKVLPSRSMDELAEIRRLKEDGLTNPQVLEGLEAMRAKADKPSARAKKEAEPKKTVRRVSESAKEKAEAKAEKAEASKAESAKSETASKKDSGKKEIKRTGRALRKEAVAEQEEPEDEEQSDAVAVAQVDSDEPNKDDGAISELAADGRSKHSLTCQTCGNVFEHMNPRLRDCLECYRAKRKERRRGGDKHKNIIQHPLAQQVANKQQQREGGLGGDFGDEPRSAREPREPREGRDFRSDRESRREGRPAARDRYMDEPAGTAIDASPLGGAAQPSKRLSQERVSPLSTGLIRQPVRNCRKAIEETRGITANLKRRLERPDLPENERRWLEQIYAYQLILHQGWRHLAEYKAGNTPQKPET